jgi:predicted nucleic acid-binding protein
VILVDTGPLVALFDPKDDAHQQAKSTLSQLREPLVTTVPVLTEAFHLLDPGSQGSSALRTFVQRGGARLWYLSNALLGRAFELMDKYADQPMDLADASLVTAAESLRVTRVFTVDRRDFTVYRVRFGRQLKRFVVVDACKS